MKTANLALAVLLLFGSSVLVLAHRHNVEGFTLTGHILTKGSTRFNIKLYPPKRSGRAVLLTNADNQGNFTFSRLAASSYLLEVYVGDDLVNQQVIEIGSDKEITIDLR